MQKPYDVMAKGLVEGALSGPCEVRTEQEAVADARAIDAVVVPDPARLQELAARGLLGRVAQRLCAIEAFHEAPSADDLDECLLRVVALHARQRATWRALPVAERGAPPVRAAVWVVSAGDPVSARREWGLVDLPGWPSGCLGSGSERGPHVIVARELPRTRETLLVRMMGAGDTLRAAYEDLRTLPADAWERGVLTTLLELLRSDLPRMGLPVYTAFEDEMTTYQEAARIVEERERRMRAEVRAEAVAESRAEVLLPQCERRLGRGLTEAERATVLARVDTLGPVRVGEVVLDLDGPQFAAWLGDADAR